MLKVFLTATAGGLLALSFLEYFNLFKRTPRGPIRLSLFAFSGSKAKNPVTDKDPLTVEVNKETQENDKNVNSLDPNAGMKNHDVFT